MEIVVSKDSDGIEHRAIRQRTKMSCGPAAVSMLASLARGVRIGNDERQITTISAGFPGSLLNSDLMSGLPGGDYGSATENLIKVIVNLGLTVRTTDKWNAVNDQLPRTLSAALVGPRTPALVLFGWHERDQDGDWQRLGGHFVVATRISSSGRLVLLDPVDGLAHEIANNGRYQRDGYLEHAVYVSARV